MSNTATATLSADDVRRLVMESWCHECNAPIETLLDATHEHDNTRQALWARCPDCQTEGLICPAQYDGDLARSYIWQLNGHNISTSAAIDLILMAIARDATAKFNDGWTADDLPQWQDAYDDVTDAVMSGDLPGAVAARHRLADLKDKT